MLARVIHTGTMVVKGYPSRLGNTSMQGNRQSSNSWIKVAFQSMSLSHEVMSFLISPSEKSSSYSTFFYNICDLLQEYYFGHREQYLLELLLKLMMFHYIKIYSDKLQYLKYIQFSLRLHLQLIYTMCTSLHNNNY